jgi:cytochrome c5
VSHSDSSFFKTLITVIVILTAFMLMSIFIARTLTGESPDAIASDPMYQAALLERIKPVGQVRTGASAATGGADAVVSGEKIYTSACFACHGTGAAGAPKLGDKAAWKARIAQGMPTLISHAIKGFKGMPAKGGRADLSDDAVKAAIKHMVDNSK